MDSLIYQISCLLQVHIIDAKRFSEEPVAKITLPQRVPYGFHGNFFYTSNQR
jgi:carotenoid cleavage dioxygenase